MSGTFNYGIRQSILFDWFWTLGILDIRGTFEHYTFGHLWTVLDGKSILNISSLGHFLALGQYYQTGLYSKGTLSSSWSPNAEELGHRVEHNLLLLDHPRGQG